VEYHALQQLLVYHGSIGRIGLRSFISDQLYELGIDPLKARFVLIEYINGRGGVITVLGLKERFKKTPPEPLPDGYIISNIHTGSLRRISKAMIGISVVKSRWSVLVGLEKMIKLTARFLSTFGTVSRHRIPQIPS
jgi:hypothetical protein